MALNREEILVIVENKVLGAEELAKEGKLIKEVKNESGELTRVFEKQTATERQRLTVKEKTLANGKQQVTTNKETLAQGPPFQAHFLGLMFGGMALNRAMSNLTATSKDWVGTGEIMSTTMGVVMLPATMQLLEEGVLPLSEALLGLPEDIKLNIGISALALEGIGKVLELGGQIGLFKLAFPTAFLKMAINLEKMAIAIGGVSGGITILGVAIAALAFNQYIDSLAEYSKAWNDLGDSIETTTDILGQAGQETRTIEAPGISEKMEKIARGGIRESLIERGVDPAELDFIGPRQLPSLPTFASIGLPSPSSVFGELDAGGRATGFGGGNQGGSINITNNVNVADKREFEQMLKVNNANLVRKVRRNATV